MILIKDRHSSIMTISFFVSLGTMILIKDRHYFLLFESNFLLKGTMILIKDRHFYAFHSFRQRINTSGTMILIKDRHLSCNSTNSLSKLGNYDTYKGSTQALNSVNELHSITGNYDTYKGLTLDASIEIQNFF